MKLRKISVILATALCCAGLSANPVLAADPVSGTPVLEADSTSAGEAQSDRDSKNTLAEGQENESSDEVSVTADDGTAGVLSVQEDTQNKPAEDGSETSDPEGSVPGENPEDPTDPTDPTDPGENPGEEPEKKASVTLKQTELLINTINTTHTIEAVVEDASDDTKITWTSSNPEVAVVDAQTGIITTVSKGQTVITATVSDGENGSAECVVKVDKLLNGLVKDPTGETADKCYYKDGVFQDVTDVLQIGKDGKWYNLVNGRLQPSTVAQNKNGWWFINSLGVVDFKYNGFAQNKNGWWYCTNGKVTFKEHNVIQDTHARISGAKDWWYVNGSKVQFTNTVARNKNGWWRIENGKVNFKCNSVEKNENGWWYIKNGKVDFGFTGLARNANGWWRIEHGKVNFQCNSVEKNSYGWWYVKNGKVDFGYTGVARNANGWWRIEKGKVNFGFNGIAQNEHGWWYLKNGRVDFGFTGLAHNQNGWWRIEKGKVNFGFNGIATNANGSWYVRKGKVDFGFSGNVTYNGKVYTVTKGKAVLSISAIMDAKAQAAGSATNWLLMVDYDNCYVGVYQRSGGNWNRVYYWRCSAGAPDSVTAHGTFRVTGKGLRFGENHGYTCWYYTQFFGDYLIHSVKYNIGSQTSVQDGRLGMHISGGCVRLPIEQAKWIHDNIPYNSRVVVY